MPLVCSFPSTTSPTILNPNAALAQSTPYGAHRPRDVHGKHDSSVVDMRPGMGVKMEMTRTDSVRVVHLLVIHTEPVELHRHEAKPYTNPSENDPYVPFPS